MLTDGEVESLQAERLAVRRDTHKMLLNKLNESKDVGQNVVWLESVLYERILNYSINDTVETVRETAWKIIGAVVKIQGDGINWNEFGDRVLQKIILRLGCGSDTSKTLYPHNEPSEEIRISMLEPISALVQIKNKTILNGEFYNLVMSCILDRSPMIQMKILKFVSTLFSADKVDIANLKTMERKKLINALLTTTHSNRAHTRASGIEAIGEILLYIQRNKETMQNDPLTIIDLVWSFSWNSKEKTLNWLESKSLKMFDQALHDRSELVSATSLHYLIMLRNLMSENDTFYKVNGEPETSWPFYVHVSFLVSITKPDGRKLLVIHPPDFQLIYEHYFIQLSTEDIDACYVEKNLQSLDYLLAATSQQFFHCHSNFHKLSHLLVKIARKADEKDKVINGILYSVALQLGSHGSLNRLSEYFQWVQNQQNVFKELYSDEQENTKPVFNSSEQNSLEISKTSSRTEVLSTKDVCFFKVASGILAGIAPTNVDEEDLDIILSFVSKEFDEASLAAPYAIAIIGRIIHILTIATDTRRVKLRGINYNVVIHAVILCKLVLICYKAGSSDILSLVHNLETKIRKFYNVTNRECQDEFDNYILITVTHIIIQEKMNKITEKLRNFILIQVLKSSVANIIKPSIDSISNLLGNIGHLLDSGNGELKLHSFEILFLFLSGKSVLEPDLWSKTVVSKTVAIISGGLTWRIGLVERSKRKLALHCLIHFLNLIVALKDKNYVQLFNCKDIAAKCAASMNEYTDGNVRALATKSLTSILSFCTEYDVDIDALFKPERTTKENKCLYVSFKNRLDDSEENVRVEALSGIFQVLLYLYRHQIPCDIRAKLNVVYSNNGEYKKEILTLSNIPSCTALDVEDLISALVAHCDDYSENVRNKAHHLLNVVFILNLERNFLLQHVLAQSKNFKNNIGFEMSSFLSP